jgi:hypothetical protein
MDCKEVAGFRLFRRCPPEAAEFRKYGAFLATDMATISGFLSISGDDMRGTRADPSGHAQAVIEKRAD